MYCYFKYEVPYTVYMGLFYVPTLLATYVYIFCIASPILHKMVPIIYYSVIRTIMGPSYVHRLLWGLTPIQKMVP